MLTEMRLLLIDPKFRTPSCRQKNHYPTEHMAEQARLARQEKHGWLLNHYVCDQCGEWHLARAKTREGKPIPIVGGFQKERNET